MAANIQNNKRVVTRTQILDWITYSGTFLELGLIMGSPGPILMDLQTQVNSSLTVISYLFAFRGIGYMVGAKISGIILDRFMKHIRINRDNHGKLTPHNIYFIMLLVSNIMYVFVTFTKDVYLLGFWVLISGIMLGGMDTFGNVLLLASFDTKDESDPLVSAYMQFLHFAFGFGAFMAPLLIQLSFHLVGNYYYAYYIMAVMSVPFLVMLVCRKTPVRESELNEMDIVDDESKESNEGPELELISVNNGNNIDGNDGTATPKNAHLLETENESKDDELIPKIKNDENNGCKDRCQYGTLILIMFAVFLGVYVGSEVGYGAYITTYTIEFGSSNDSIGRIMTSVYWGALSFGRLISVCIAKMLSSVNMIILDFIGCSIACILLLIGHGNLNIIYISSSIYGLSMANIFPTTIMLAESTIKVTGNNASLMIVGASIGEFLLPTLAGNIISIFGVPYFHTIITIFTLICIVIFLVILLLRVKIKSQN